MRLNSIIGGAVLEVHFQRQTTAKDYSLLIPGTLSQFLSLMESVYAHDQGDNFGRLVTAFSEEVTKYLSAGTTLPAEDFSTDMTWQEMADLEEFMDSYHKSKKE